ncbi:MAG: hypothetical protein IKJ59_06250 [Clostridia bacterium]|nr:hypothetical protein [Clostridia bacterium]
MAAPAIAAVAKKVIVSVLTNPKALKKVLGIILCVVLVILMPLAAVIAVFSGDIEFEPSLLQQHVEQQLTEEEIAMLQSVEDTMIGIENKMNESGYSQIQIKQAQVLYTLALYDYSDEENFIDRLVGCFSMEQTYEELVNNVNLEFGTNVAATELQNIMESTQSDSESQQEDTTWQSLP